jgi:hypothetical protein
VAGGEGEEMKYLSPALSAQTVRTEIINEQNPFVEI